MTQTLVKVLLALGAGVGCTAAARSLIHLFQLESYQLPGFRRTVMRTWRRTLLPGAFMTVLTCALLMAWNTLNLYAPNGAVAVVVALCVAALCVLGGFWCARLFHDKAAKKPLVYTPRVKRLIAVTAVLCTGLCLLVRLLVAWPYALAAFPALLPVWVALSGLCAWPIEKGISECYFRDAQRILRERPDLIRIGITGSYGKTSVKFILGTILQEKYQTLVTPASFNTPMGVTKVIREKLRPGHQVFVAEMGARHVGDIKEMCRLVHPVYGVLTSVGPQHLDTFRSLERIKSTKYELMDAVPPEGCCFFPDDQGICRELYDKTTKPKQLASLTDQKADVYAEDVRVSPEGSSFVLHAGDEHVLCQTKLLGAHSIQNILLASTVARALGMTLKQIARGIGKIEPVEHRLQLLPASGGTTVIDDAFNSNPRGAKAALDVLGAFPGRRIIITPGMVELGAEEAQFNREFGSYMMGRADVAILVGRKHSAPIREGALAAGMGEKNVYSVGSLDEATALWRQLSRPGDVVLFENDLPDNYSET